jgi:L-ribulose-5-phosphate 3-epimerase
VVSFGARAHDFGRGDAAFIAECALRGGVSCLQLAPAKALADCPPPPEPMEEAWAARVAATLGSRGISVAVLGCYVDICGPDPLSRRAAVDRLAHNLSIAHRFGARVVGTETPLSGGEPAEAIRSLRDSVAELLPLAECSGSLLCIEPVWGHALSSPRAMAALLEEIASPALCVILDPVNLVDPSSAEEPERRALEALDLFAERVRAVHAKDFTIAGGAKVPAIPGTGLMDWKRLAPAIAAAAPAAPFIVEEQDGPGLAAGLALLRSALA